MDDPYIIPVYEADEADGVLFIAMRFVQGGDLRQVLEREGALPPDRVVGFISPVASALDAAHRAGLVHRDVKPANILVDAREDRPDHVFLSDFGVSKAMSSVGLTGTGMFVGSPDYSAPEQIQGRAVDGRTDQYALGCVTYQLLAGALPFQGDQDMSVLLAHLSAPPPSLVSRMPNLPGAVNQVLARAMAKAPEKRYASCLDFADALREALGLTPHDPQSSATAPAVPQPATSPHEIPPRRGFVDRPSTITARIRRRRLPLLVLTCAILAAAGVIPFVLTSPVKSPGPAHSPSPANSPHPAHAPSYSRAGIDLPSPYAGNSVSSLAFSPSGATLAIADIYICLWDIAATGCTTASVFTDENSVAFSPDGKTCRRRCNWPHLPVECRNWKTGRDPHGPQQQGRGIGRVQSRRQDARHRRLQWPYLPVECRHRKTGCDPHRPEQQGRGIGRVQSRRQDAGRRRLQRQHRPVESRHRKTGRHPHRLS